MSLRIEWRIAQNSGTYIAPDSVVLCDPSGVYGVRRSDTQETVVNANAVMTAYVPDDPEEDSAYYYYEFEEPSPSLEYEYYIKVTETANGTTNTFYIEGHISGSPAWTSTDTLGGVRKLLVDVSGRWDLVRNPAAGDYTDKGLCKIYLNEAQKWLDQRLPYHKSRAKLYKDVALGENSVTFTSARAVQDVFVVNTDKSLQRIDWWTLPLGLAPDQASAEDYDDLPTGAENVAFGNHWPTHGIYFEPDDTAARVLLVDAHWYSPALNLDTDKSFWTVEKPLLLVHTAIMLIESGIGNSTRVRELASVIQDDLQQIYHNLVEEETAGPPSRWRMT